MFFLFKVILLRKVFINIKSIFTLEFISFIIIYFIKFISFKLSNI